MEFVFRSFNHCKWQGYCFCGTRHGLSLGCLYGIAGSSFPEAAYSLTPCHTNRWLISQITLLIAPQDNLLMLSPFILMTQYFNSNWNPGFYFLKLVASHLLYLLIFRLVELFVGLQDFFNWKMIGIAHGILNCTFYLLVLHRAYQISLFKLDSNEYKTHSQPSIKWRTF